MIRINRGNRLLGGVAGSGGGGGPPVVIDNSGSSPWHIIATETIIIPDRRQMSIHGMLLLEGQIDLVGSAQLVIEN